MKSTTFILLLLVTSAFLFAPTIQPKQEVELAPKTPMTMLLIVRSTTLEFTSDIKSTVYLNISLIDAEGTPQVKQTNAQIVEQSQFTLTETGTYQVTLLSDTFGFVYIKQSGVTNYQLIYYTLLIIAFLFVYNRKYRIIG